MRRARALPLGAFLLFSGCAIACLYRAGALQFDLDGSQPLRILLLPLELLGGRSDLAPGYPLPDEEAIHRYYTASAACAVVAALWLPHLVRRWQWQRRLLRLLLGRTRRPTGKPGSPFPLASTTRLKSR